MAGPEIPYERREPEDSWMQYRRLVLGELERLNLSLAALAQKMDSLNLQRDQSINDLKVEVAMLKVKATMMGMGAGAAMSGIVAVVVQLLKRP